MPQPHGGALRNGGTNRGGPGRVPSVVRERCRGSFAKRVTVLEEIADDKEATAADRIRVIDLLDRYGLGTHPPVDVEDSSAPFVVQVMAHPGHFD